MSTLSVVWVAKRFCPECSSGETGRRRPVIASEWANQTQHSEWFDHPVRCINAVLVMAVQGAKTFGLAVVRRGEPIQIGLATAMATREGIPAGVTIPVLFLFVCDPAHNFYQAFFLLL